MPDAKPATMNYARPAIRLRQWIRRGLLLVWAILTLYLVYDKWVLRVRLQSQMLAAQRAALRLTEPPERVVFESDPECAKALLATHRYGEAYGSVFLDERGAASAASEVVQATGDAYWLAMRDIEWWDQRNEPPSQAALTGLLGGGDLFGGSLGGDKGMGPRDQFLVFLHERRARRGEPRLVGLMAYLYADGSVRFDADVLSVANPFRRPERLEAAAGPMMSDAGVVAVTPLGGPLRLFAPQPDAADPSRFTIPYKNGSRGGTVEGRLKPDDSVEFKLLPGTGPPTQRSAVQPKRVGNYDPADAKAPEPASAP